MIVVLVAAGSQSIPAHHYIEVVVVIVVNSKIKLNRKDPRASTSSAMAAAALAKL